MPDLKNARIAVLAADDFEEVELTKPVEAFRDAGARVDVIAPHGGKLQAMQHDQKSIRVEIDRMLQDASPEDYDAVVLPGGALNADFLRMDGEARRFVQAMDQDGKVIAAICHAPWLLVSAELVAGKTLTSYPTLQDDIRNAGGEWVDREVVTDGNWITSRKPDDLPAFNREAMAAVERSLQATAGHGA